MKTNSRFAVLDFKAQRLYVYEQKRLLAVYEIEGPISAEEVEEARTMQESSKA